uniref:Serpentine receptor class gamma n=1 Tax=Caenorhabditis tropicalis TaxID=1561998 RepID=A0A1I7T1M9_9PELO
MGGWTYYYGFNKMTWCFFSLHYDFFSYQLIILTVFMMVLKETFSKTFILVPVLILNQQFALYRAEEQPPLHNINARILYYDLNIIPELFLPTSVFWDFLMKRRSERRKTNQVDFVVDTS